MRQMRGHESGGSGANLVLAQIPHGDRTNSQSEQDFDLLESTVKITLNNAPQPSGQDLCTPAARITPGLGTPYACSIR